MAADSKKFWMLAAAATALVAPAQAQQPAAKAQEEEIVVTATKRESRLQDVPVAVTPITAAMIENSGIRDVQDLQAVVPTLQFNVSESQSSATARLRGIGTQGSNPGLESSVGIFIDGVYRARNSIAMGDLGELSQIEVLRGPQGTLFGRNTSAGLISVATRGPQMDTFGASGEVTAANYNGYRVAGHITGPLVENVLGFRLYGATGKRDGFMPLIDATGAKLQDTNNQDFWTVRGQLKWEPSDTLSVRLIGDFSKRDEACCGAKWYNPAAYNGAALRDANGNPVTFPSATSGAAAALGAFGPTGLARLTTNNGNIDSEDDRFGSGNIRQANIVEDKGFSAEVNWDVGEVKVTSITAYRDWDFYGSGDRDFSAADIWRTPLTFNGQRANGTQNQIFTQELRVNGELGNVNWMVGGFYADEEIKRVERVEYGAAWPSYFALLFGANPTIAALPAPARAALTAPLANFVGRGSLDRHNQDGRSWSMFTHNIWSVDDKTDFTFGVRYTEDKKALRSTFLTEVAGLPLVGGLAPTLIGLGIPAPVAAALVPAVGGAYLQPWQRNLLDAAGFNQSRKESKWSGIVSLRRSFTDNVSGYASLARGYKAGGFNLDRSFSNYPGGATANVAVGQPNTSFAPETVDAYELGLKTRFGPLTLNTALFYNDFQNFQLNRFDGVSFIVTSIPEVSTKGAEVDAMWRTPVPGLTYQGGLAYTDARYGDNSAGWASVANGLFRLPNNQLTNAPKWTTSHAFTYERSLFNDTLTGLAYLDFRYESKQITGSDLNPTKLRPANTSINGRLGLTTKDERYSVQLWGRNLANTTENQIAFDVPAVAGAFGAFLNEPRTYGVTLKAGF